MNKYNTEILMLLFYWTKHVTITIQYVSQVSVYQSPFTTIVYNKNSLE